MVKIAIEKAAVPFIVIILIAALLFWKVLLNPDKIIYSKSSDTIAQFVPWKFFISETLKLHSQMPLWDPHNFGGTPFFADFQSTIFYPLNIPMYFNFNFASFGYRFLLDILLAGVFTYLFARELKLPKASALVAAAIFMLSMPIVSKVYAGHLITVDAIALMPLGFLIVERLASRKTKLDSIFLGIFFTLYLLGGNIQHFLYTIISLFLYYAIRTNTLGLVADGKVRTAASSLSKFLIAVLIFIGISSFQLFPSFELSKSVTRSGGVSFNFAIDGSLQPEQLITFLIPSFFGLPFNDTYWGTSNFWEVTGYFGIGSLLLVAMAFYDFKNKNVKTFAFFLIFSLLFSLGVYGLIFPIFYHIVPFFNMFRIPARFLFITTFSAAVLAGFGVKHLLENKINFRGIFYVIFVAAILFGVGIFIIELNKDRIIDYGNQLGTQKYLNNPNYISRPLEYYLARVETAYNSILIDIVKLFLVTTAIAASLFMLIKKWIAKEIFGYVILFLIVLDLMSLGINFIDVKDANAVYQRDHIVNFLGNTKGLYRIHNINFTVSPEMVFLNNFRSVFGYNPLEPKNYIDALNAAGVKYYSIDGERSLKWLGILNTKYVISDSKIELDGLTEVLSDGSKYVYENGFFEAIAFVAFDYVVMSDEEIFNVLNLGAFDSNVALVNEKPSGESIGRGLSIIRIKKYTPNEIELSVVIDKPGLLVLSDNYYPGWTAHVDGKETKIIKSYSTLKSVWLEAGEHSAVFSFYPKNLNLYLILTIVTVFAAVVYYRRR